MSRAHKKAQVEDMKNNLKLLKQKIDSLERNELLLRSQIALQSNKLMKLQSEYIIHQIMNNNKRQEVPLIPSSSLRRNNMTEILLSIYNI